MISRLFKYIFGGIGVFFKVIGGFFSNVSVAFVKTIAAGAFWSQSAPGPTEH
jgi:hypothetical protein